ncbi:hypothetical protein GGR28_002843 [Lewinella aquimaris]|uniref:Uncharacterized protein n=1 Tax=Neolewinella aquimaris TaxID=1835722 RepID=A0A840E8F4_9BACT|nr:hypothetical protein [Neolewinella aquimaris]
MIIMNDNQNLVTPVARFLERYTLVYIAAYKVR